jgi:hypothetical protein
MFKINLQDDSKKSQASTYLKKRYITQFFFIYTMLFTLGGSLSGCSTDGDSLAMLPPQCIPGIVHNCGCLNGSNGIQICSDEGRYQACKCRTSNPCSASQTQPASANPFDQAGTPSSFLDEVQFETKKTSPSLENDSGLMAEANGESASDHQETQNLKEETYQNLLNAAPSTRTTSMSPKPGQMMWWYASLEQKSCYPANHVDGQDLTPETLLLDPKCDAHNQSSNTQFLHYMIRCGEGQDEDTRLFHYYPSQQKCKQELKELMQAEEQKKAAIFRPPPFESGQSVKSKRKSVRKKDSAQPWHCMCYKERYNGNVVTATACRPTQALCSALERKVSYGSRTLIAESMSVACQTHILSKPWDQFGRKAQWLPSTQEGAYWSPSQCFLKARKKNTFVLQTKKKAQKKTQKINRPSLSSSTLSVRSSKKTRSKKTRFKKTRSKSKQIQSNELQKNVPPPSTSKRSDTFSSTQTSLTPAPSKTVFTSSIRSNKQCEEGCWAYFASSSQRRKRFKTSHIPDHLKWVSKYGKDVELTYKMCQARVSNRHKHEKHSKCFRTGVQACQSFCKRSNKR